MQNLKEIEKAYRDMLKLHKRAEAIAKSVKDNFSYSPFQYMGSKIREELRDIRNSLIKESVSHFQGIYAPNLKVEVKDFSDLMNEKAGREGFRVQVIEGRFKRIARAKTKLARESLKDLLEKARYFLPWRGYNDKAMKVKDLVKGCLLEIKAYTWDKGDSWRKGSIRWGLDRERYEALDKIIDIATLKADPAEVGPGIFADHITPKEGTNTGLIDPAQFYGKHTVKHKAIAAFQFYKNQKFKIWFKKPGQARAVAKLLLKGRSKA